MSTYVCNVGNPHEDYLLPPPDWSDGQQKPTLNLDPNGVLLPPPQWDTARADPVAQPVASHAGAAGVPLPGMVPTVNAADVLLPPPDWSNR